MGLDVFAVRCHVHNISHTGPCPKCEAERAERHAAENAKRKQLGPQPPDPDDCAACKAAAAKLPPVLQLPPEAPEPMHIRRARERAAAVAAHLSSTTLDQLSAMLTELHLLQVAKEGALHRWELPPVRISSMFTCTIEVPTYDASRLIRIDVSCDQGQQLLHNVRVCTIRVGTRTIGEGGSLAQLNRCALPRLPLIPGLGLQLIVENLSAYNINLRGVVLAELEPRFGRTPPPSRMLSGIEVERALDDLDGSLGNSHRM